MQTFVVNEAVMSCCARPRSECRCKAFDWARGFAERQRDRAKDLLPLPGSPLAADVQEDPDPEAPLPLPPPLFEDHAVNQRRPSVNAATDDDDLLLPPPAMTW